LFNIAQCYRNIGDLDKAIFSFKKYLKEQPDAQNKDAVEKLVEALEEKKSQNDGAKLVDKDKGAKRESVPIYKQWWFWAGVGVVAVAGSVGIYEGTKGGPPGTDLGNIVFGK
jgi:tetratricopeptide (TPR) repeat protein